MAGKRIQRLRKQNPELFMRKGLHPQALRAIDEYMINGHKGAAALAAAGYSPKYSPSVFFAQVAVKEEVGKRLAILAKQNEVTAAQVDQAWKTLAFAEGVGGLLEVNEDGSAWLDMRKLTKEQRDCIKAVTAETYVEGLEVDEETGVSRPVRVRKTKVEFYDRTIALQRWDKRLRLTAEKVEVSGELSVVERLKAGRLRAARGD